MNVSSSASQQNGLKCKARTVATISEQMEKITSSTVLAALNNRSMTRENQYCSKRSSDAPTCYACVVKPIAVMIVKNKSISLPVKD